jgi:hypothetical protein
METSELLTMQKTYKTAVDEWKASIREEEDLASTEPRLALVDKWEQAHFTEEAARNKAKKAKKEYEDAIRQSMFNF